MQFKREMMFLVPNQLH